MDANKLLQDVKNYEDGLHKGNLQKKRNLARHFVYALFCGVEAKSVVASVLGAGIEDRGC